MGNYLIPISFFHYISLRGKDNPRERVKAEMKLNGLVANSF